MVRLLRIIITATLLGCATPERSEISTRPVASPPIRVADNHVYISREVIMPGAYPWTNGMRLTDLITQSGGLTQFAIRSRIRIFHLDATEEVHNYDRILKRKAADPMLKPRDIVSVTSSIF